MELKKWLKEKIEQENKLLFYLYSHVFLKIKLKIKFKYKVEDRGKNNCVKIGNYSCSDDLRITFDGSDNSVYIGTGCKLHRSNRIFIQGKGNRLIIGDNVTFDQDVSIVVVEGTKCVIGKDSIFAKGVRIRTGDQHSIYDSSGYRINPSKDVHIGEHVWVGASVIVMKGAVIGSGSVIGMDSMITHNIPENCIAVGKPAKSIKDNIYWKEY